MSKVTRALAFAVATTILLGSPLVFQAADAATLPKTTQQQLPKPSAADKAKFDAAVQRANMAFEKSQGDKAFNAAVKAKDAAAVKRILMKNGADAIISKVIFEGPTPGAAQKIKITISGSYPPPTLIITIKF